MLFSGILNIDCETRVLHPEDPVQRDAEIGPRQGGNRRYVKQGAKHSMEPDLISTIIDLGIIDFIFGIFTGIYDFLFAPVTGIISTPYENFLRTVFGTLID
jgi:hypothetical protein